MAFRLSESSFTAKTFFPGCPSTSSKLYPTCFFFFCNTGSSSPLKWRRELLAFSNHCRRIKMTTSCLKLEEKSVSETGNEWGKVSAVLFDMDGVLCNSEEPSRMAAVDVFAEMGVEVTTEDFVPFMGMGEANFLGGVASAKGVKGFNPGAAKKRFFEIYLDKYAKPNSGIGFPGALELITECKKIGLKVAVASSADRIKVDANLAAAGLPISLFDAIVSADAFENLKPAPDIFIAASKILDVPPNECIVIEDALAGVQAAKAAEMRCIAVTTTLTEDTLKQAGPSLIRKEIGSISLQDILAGGGVSVCHNEKMQVSQTIDPSVKQISPEMLKEKAEVVSTEDLHHNNEKLLSGGRNNLMTGFRVPEVIFWVMEVWALLSPVSSSPLPIGRGVAPVVPEFPSKLDWLNTAPLQFRQKFTLSTGLRFTPQVCLQHFY